MPNRFNNTDSEIQALDEQRQMRNLANAVRLADGFSLLFVRCNQRPRQREIIAELEQKLDGFRIKVILLEEKVEHLLDELQARLGDERYDAVFVYGLESSFPNADTAAESPFVVTLNHARNSFKNIVKCPLVLFLPEYALSAIYHGATDFYSIRSGVYLFSAKAEETEYKISEQITPVFRELSGLLLQERQNKIEIIESLIAESQSLPNSQRNLDKEYSLKSTLADLYDISADYDKAEELYKETIEYYRGKNDLTTLSNSLVDLGLIYNSKKKFKQALELIEEALKINEKIHGINHPHYAICLGNLALIYDSQGNYNEAIKLYEKSLSIEIKTGLTHPANFMLGLNNLANAYRNQGRYDEAIKSLKEAMEIGEKINAMDHPEYAVILASLTRLYYEQQKYQEALTSAKRAYEIRRKTLGINHPETRDIKRGIEINKAMIKKRASLIVPYKN